MQIWWWTILKHYNKSNNFKQINNYISYDRLRVVGDEGQLGIMSKFDALNKAQFARMDLVVINEKSNPPVAKLVNANKYFYEQKKKQKQAAKKQRENQIVLK